MKITIDTKEEGNLSYETDLVDDPAKKMIANSTVRKVSVISTLIEALTFANIGHKAGLATLLSECDEAKLDPEITEIGDKDLVDKEADLFVG